MRRILAEFQCAQVGRVASVTIRHIRKDRTLIDRRGLCLQPEIQVFSLIQLLHVRGVLSIKPWNVDEYVIVHQNAVLILMRRAAVFFQTSKASRL